MASRIFRFYSLEPRTIFLMASKRWPSAIVRRNAWKIGASPISYTTLVLDDQRAADEFEEWLGRHTTRGDISKFVQRAGEVEGGRMYRDVIFHRGSLVAQAKLIISVPAHRFRRNSSGFRRALLFWLRLKS